MSASPFARLAPGFVSLAALAVSACSKPAETVASEAPSPETSIAEDVTQPVTPRLAAPTSFEEAVAAFDYRTQHIVWVLPPGVDANGPFEARVVVRHDGVTQYGQVIPLAADFPASGSRPEFPAGAEVVRLSADATWASRLAEIRDVVDRLKAEHGPGGGELTITSDFRTAIGANVRKAYCDDDQMPDVGVFLEQDDELLPLPVGASAPILRGAILKGCED